MTAAYEYDNLPDPDEMAFAALPAEMFDDAKDAFFQALESGLARTTEAKAFHVFNRKDYLEAQSFIGLHNQSYRSDTDDVVLQLTIRIPNPKTEGKSLSAVAALEDIATEYTKEAERKRLEAELAKAEKDAEKAEVTAREARAKLEALRKK